jgi:hypothetical protein
MDEDVDTKIHILTMTKAQEQLNNDVRIADQQLAHAEKDTALMVHDKASIRDEWIEMMQGWADLVNAQKQT